MSSFFIPPKAIKGKIAVISGSEAHHILDVMRLKVDDTITAFDGSGKLYQGSIIAIDFKQVKLQIDNVISVKGSLKVQLALACALPKKHKMDYIVEKATELGIDVIIPVESARTIVRLDHEKKIKRKVRWQKIAKETAKQCARSTVPDIKPVSSFAQALRILSNFDLKLVFCLTSKTRPIKKILKTHKKPKRIAICIGPEGDFTPDEIANAHSAGCVLSSLGSNVLKVDTAAISALAMINYELS